MKNLFNNFMVNVLSMAHEDPPTGNGGNNNSGTGTNTGGNTGNNGTTDPEDLNDNPNQGGTNEGGNSSNSSGGGITEDGRPIPDVGIGGF